MLTLLKAAFLLKPRATADSAENYVGIGKALLMITDLINGEPGRILELEPSDPGYEDHWLQYVLINELSSDRKGNEKNALVRAYDLYLTDKLDLVNCGSYMDLPATCRAVTGLDPKALWLAIWALVAYWANISVEKIGSESMAISRSDYFSKSFRFSDEELNSFFATSATEIEVLQQIIQSKYSLADLKPFHLLPFSQWPLVMFGDRVYCVSIKLLMEKITRGLHYLYMDPSLPEGKRKRFLDYVGRVFEDYVERLFTRIYPPISGRYLSLDKLSAKRSKSLKKHCEGLVIYDNAVILIEVKASLFTVEARSGLDVTKIKSRLQYFYQHAAEQIQETISAVKKGLLASEGVSPQRISVFYPLVVTLEPVPMTPLLYAEIQKMLKSENLLASSDVKPFQCMDIGCLEEIEAIVSSGVSMRQLLDEKLSSQTSIEDSFANFLYRNRRRWGDLQNEWLSERYKVITKEAKEYLSDRQRQDVT